MRYLALLLFPLLLTLQSCGFLAQQQQGEKLDRQTGRIEQVDQLLQKMSAGLAVLVTSVEEMKEAKAQAREAADVNKDGKLDAGEMLTYGGLLAAALAEMARRKMKALQGNIEQVNGRVDHERALRKEAEDAEYEELMAAQKRLAELRAQGKA